MIRGIVVGNKKCAKWDEQRRHEMHRERIRNMRPVTDTSEPSVWQLDHIRNNMKREQMLEERYSEIDRENRILLKKMSDIMKTQTTPRTMEKLQQQQPGGPQSLNRDYRKKELLRITRENQFILRRIQQAQPIYNHIQWEAEHRKNVLYRDNCAEYPPVLKNRRDLTPRSELVPLQEEDIVNETVPTVARSGAPQAPLAAIDAPREDVVRSVLKEGRKIGETYYLVQMTTDGCTLNISAYDGDKYTTLELAVKEQLHRKLYRETNGDYGLLADRLRVTESSNGLYLVLDDVDAPAVPGVASMPATARGASSSPPTVRGPASSPPTARGASSPPATHREAGKASKAAEGVRESTAAYIQMQQALPGIKSPSPPSASPPPARTTPQPAWGAGQAQAAPSQKPPQAPGAPPAKRNSKPARRPSGDEIDAETMVTARGGLGSAGGVDSDRVQSAAATVYSAGFPSAPGTAGSTFACEVQGDGDEAEFRLRGLTPDRECTK